MSFSLIEIIGSAIAAARQAGLDAVEEREAAHAVLLAYDDSLTPGVARILVEQLYLQAAAQFVA